MFSGFFVHTYFMGVVLALLVLSILFQIIIGLLYRKIIRETDNMAVTEHKLLKQCKLKFSNCYELNEGNVNVPVFVDKFVSQLRFAGVSLTNMSHLSGQLMLLSVFAAGVGACKGIIDGDMLGELLPYYIASLFGLYAYFSVSSLVDAKGKNSMVRTNLIDYLENHMVKHLILAKDEEMQPYIIKDSMKEAVEEIQETEEGRETEETGLVKLETRRSFTEQDQDELEELLQEFLA